MRIDVVPVVVQFMTKNQILVSQTPFCSSLTYQLLGLFIFSFWMTSIQYRSGSRMKATFLIRPSVRRFFQLTFASSKRRTRRRGRQLRRLVHTPSAFSIPLHDRK